MNGWRSVRGASVSGGGRRSSSPDDDSAVLVDNRSDGEEDSDGGTRQHTGSDTSLSKIASCC